MTKSVIFQNISFLTLENIFKLIFGFATSILVARSLGKENYGHLTYVLSFTQIFLPFYAMGSNDFTISLLVKTPEDHRKTMGASFFLRTIGGLAGFLILNLIAGLLKPEDTIIRIFIFLYSMAFLLKAIDPIDCWFISVGKIKEIAGKRIIALLISFLLKLALLYFKASWDKFIIVSMNEIILFSAIYYFSYRKNKLEIARWKIDKDQIKYLFKNSFPMFLITFSGMFLLKLDQILIEKLAGAEALGTYAAGVKLIELWQFLPVVIVSAIFPKLAKARKESDEAFDKITTLLYSSLFWVALPLSIFTFSLAPFITKTLYGDKYIESIPVLAGYCWTSLFSFFTISRASILAIEEKITEGLWLTVLAIIINGALNFLLIPKYGVMGAVYSSLLAYLLANILGSLFLPAIKKNLIIYLKAIFKPQNLLYYIPALTNRFKK